MEARDYAIRTAARLREIGVHKQIANRVLEPWMWITVIASATNWANFFSLRCHPDAQPEIKKIADLAQFEYFSNEPRFLKAGEYHLPFSDDLDGLQISQQKKISAARCARVSYLSHHGLRDISADLELHDKLVSSHHWSPFEHVAQALDKLVRSGNLRGFLQYRKEFPTENKKVFVPNLPELEPFRNTYFVPPYIV